jgi:dihydrofolate reductase
MRRIVLQMMTTLNGRLDDPMAWLHGVSDDQYSEIDRLYATYDTVLVGHTTYEEMAAYWPGALSDDAGTETNRRMARRMHDYRKLVFSRSAGASLTEWNNAELVVARTHEELTKHLADLKALSGSDIHLSGGASFAQSVVALGLVDEFHFFVYPVVSAGAAWFSKLAGRHDFELRQARTFENGVVGLHYAPREAAQNAARAKSFTDMLT